VLALRLFLHHIAFSIPMPDSTPRPKPDLSRELRLWREGYSRIAGIDEVGRGCWAGPVVAAAVVFPAHGRLLAPLLGQVDDSKRLSAKQREHLYGAIRQAALAIGVGSVPASEIDHLGIVLATRLAMVQALGSLGTAPDYLLIDFLTLPEMRLPQQGLPHGDALSLSIAAASIVAKVTRDHWMEGQEILFPGYGFAHHKGYGTPEHQEALAVQGPCGLHRVTFRPLSCLAENPSLLKEAAETDTLDDTELPQ
jgi:ribonuclease HII